MSRRKITALAVSAIALLGTAAPAFAHNDDTAEPTWEPAEEHTISVLPYGTEGEPVTGHEYVARALTQRQGLGGDSNTCSDGQWPGTGRESGQWGAGPFASIGLQAGSDTGNGHPVYLDECFKSDVPRVCLPYNVFCVPRTAYSYYDSYRAHSNKSDCSNTGGIVGGPANVQNIHNNDPGNTVNLQPNSNNCPYG